MMVRIIVRVTAALISLVLVGCAEPAFPRDPDDTLERASGGTLRVGVSDHPPFTEVADDGSVSGDEVEIIEGYAESIGATVEWRDGSESELVELLDLGQLDVVIGGIASNSPWSKHAAFTRPYTRVVGTDGKAQKMVIAARLGENALLTSLDRYLIEKGLRA